MKINIFRSYPSNIPVFITDQESDILCRLAVDRKSVTEAIFLPSDYDWYEFINEEKTFVLLDLLSILEKKNTLGLPELYREVKKTYNAEITVFFRMYIYRFIKDSKDKNDVETLKNIYLFDFLPNLQKGDKKEIGLWWDEHQHDLVKIYKEIEAEMAREAERNEESTKLGEEFDSTEPFPISDEKNLGYILQFEVKTEDTTGSCFDRFRTSEDFPLARYKTFHKKYNKNQVRNCFNTVTKCDSKNRCPHCDSEFECQPIDTAGFVQGQHIKQGRYCFQKSEDDFRYFDDLRVFNKEYEVNLHLKTTEQGLWIQCLIILGSGLDSTEKIKDMMGLEGKVSREKKFGQKMQFTIQNTYIDSSVFSDMVMNEKAFSVFFSVNDTDKISKQNRSIYLYFDDFHTKKSLKSTDILVGGWKRSFSRHGDLTAIVQSEYENGSQVCIRVIRSINENILHSFVEKISRFMKLYTLKYDQYMKLYRQLLPGFVPYKPEAPDKKEEDRALHKLIKAEPRIFISNIYGRSCQNPKPIIVDDPVILENTPDEKKLLFPPIPYEDMKPRYYVCPTEPYKGETYLYPGLKPIKMIDHPFGFFPCCYKEKNWHEKNKKKSKMIEDKIKGTAVTKLSPTKNIDHIIKTNKIIDNLGQLGTLPPPLEKFMLGLNPFYEYFRMGIPTPHNFLLCLEYQHSKKNNLPMRDVDDILKLILQKDNINIGLQENYDIGREGIIDHLKRGVVPPERFIRIFENFYDVTIFIFHKDRSGTISLRLPNHYRSYYRFRHKDRPIVALYQHWGGTMDDLIKIERAHCELIVSRAFNNKFSYQYAQQKTRWLALAKLGMQFYDGRSVDAAVSIKEDHLFGNLTSQWVDSIGKLRILFFREALPGFLLHPCAPLSLPIRDDESELPPHQELAAFLSKAGEIRVFHYRGHTFFQAEMGSIKIFFPTAGKHLAASSPGDHLHKFFDSILQFFNEDTRIYKIEYMIRISSVLQDYALYFLARFVDKEILAQPITDWVDLFFDKHTLVVPDKHIYPEFSSIPIVFQKNVKGLVKDDRILVASRVRDKLVYFIKWFMTRRGEPELVKIRKLREIPSYYQYTEDFSQLGDQVIYNYDFYYERIKTYSYIGTELSQLDQPINEPFYYYNPSQVGVEPHLLVQVSDKDRAASVARAWKKEGVLRLEEKISDEEIVVDVPIGKNKDGNVLWSEQVGSVGRVAPAKAGTFVAILNLKK